MEIGIWMPRFVVRRDDSVPDYGFRIRDSGGVGGGIGGGDVEEELLGVPVEEGGEVCVEIEALVGVFFAFGAVVVGSSFDTVNCCQ